MASTEEAAVNGEEEIQNHIKDLEAQLNNAYDELSNVTGKRNSAKRLKRDDDGGGATSSLDAEPKPIDARIVAWELHQHVETLLEQVNEDFKEGCEEQWETKIEWYASLREPLQSVLDIGVGKKAALKECNQVLKMVADSFYALLACESRLDTREELFESDASFSLNLPWGGMQEVITGERVENAWAWVWVALLRTHAALGRKEDEKALLLCIKDASDHIEGGTITLDGPLSEFIDSPEDAETPDDREGAPDGVALAKIIHGRSDEWKNLPSHKKYHRPRSSMFYGGDEDEDDDDDDDEVDGPGVAMKSDPNVGGYDDSDDDEENDEEDDDSDDDDEDGQGYEGAVPGEPTGEPMKGSPLENYNGYGEGEAPDEEDEDDDEDDIDEDDDDDDEDDEDDIEEAGEAPQPQAVNPPAVNEHEEEDDEEDDDVDLEDEGDY